MVSKTDGVATTVDDRKVIDPATAREQIERVRRAREAGAQRVRDRLGEPTERTWRTERPWNPRMTG